jgi:hypothetical protein
MFAALPILAQEHKWAGRTLTDLEWRIHQELAMIPFQGVFDTLRFELNGKTVTLTGRVVRETVKTDAERVIRRLEGGRTSSARSRSCRPRERTTRSG